MTPDALLKLGLSQSLLNLKQRVRCRSPAWGPSPAPGGKRRLGILAGKLRAPEDFDAPLPDEVIEAFEGR